MIGLSLSQFIHILFTNGYIVTISCAYKHMIWCDDCDFSTSLFLFEMCSTIQNRIFVCEYTGLLSFRPLCGVLVHAWSLRYEWKFGSIQFIDYCCFCSRFEEWQRKVEIEISFIFADQINLWTEWMKSNGIFIRNVWLSFELVSVIIFSFECEKDDDVSFDKNKIIKMCLLLSKIA